MIETWIAKHTRHEARLQEIEAQLTKCQESISTLASVNGRLTGVVQFLNERVQALHTELNRLDARLDPHNLGD